MAASRVAGIVDPTKPGEYPIVLSDALLGGRASSKETFTGITYNHKPAALSSDSTPSTARIRSSTNGVVDLSHETDDGDFGFKGARSSKDGQYVLVFDPARRVFVLHRLDSMFHMNLTLTPDNGDAAALKEEFPHLEPLKISTGKAGATASTADKKGKDKPAAARATATAKSKTGTPAGSTASTPAAKKKAEKKAAPPPAAIPLPVAAPTPPLASKPAEAPKDTKPKKPARRGLSDEESDDDDDDGGLVLEFPEGKAPAASKASRPRNDFSPAFKIRRFSEYDVEDDYGRAGGAGEQEEDADGEEDDDYDDLLQMDEPDTLKLPSPLNGGREGQQVGLGIGGVLAAGDEDEDDDEDEEMDEEALLEAELQKQLDEEEREESDVSEEE